MTIPPPAWTWDTFADRYAALDADRLTPDTVQEWLRRWSDLDAELLEAQMRLQFTSDRDTPSPEKRDALTAFLRDVLPKAQVARHRLQRRLLDLPDDALPGELHQMRRRLRNQADVYRAENVDLNAETNTLAYTFNRVSGARTVDVDGQETTFAQASRLVQSPDRDVRERTWRAMQTRALQDRDALDTLMLDLLARRRRLAAQAGMPNYLALRWLELNRLDYSPEDARSFHAAIEAEVVPLAVELREARRAALGVDTLRPWDSTVDVRSFSAPFDNVDALLDAAERVLEAVHPKYGERFRRLRHRPAEDQWLDVEARPGKAGGAYSFSLPVSRGSVILQSATGTHFDLTVLLHEAGHAMHSLALHEEGHLLFNRGVGSEFGEVPSQAMELLALAHLESAAGYSKERASAAVAKQFEDVVYALPRMALLDAWQHWLYTEAPEDVTGEDLEAKYLELARRFEPGVDWSGLEAERAGAWRLPPHAFIYPLYVLDYAYAWLGALDVWQRSLDDPQGAVEAYEAALRLGGSRSLPELYEAVGSRFSGDRAQVGALMARVREVLRTGATDGPRPPA